MQKRAVEFHDSEVESSILEGTTLKIRLSAFVHESEGRPGLDRGTGWIQTIDLVLSDAVRLSSPSKEALTISDGWVELGAERYDNLLPLPFDRTGAVRFELRGTDGTLSAQGTRLQAVPVGRPRFVEHFTGG